MLTLSCWRKCKIQPTRTWQKKGSKQVLRLLAVLLLATLLGSGGVAAGIVAGVPAIVQFVFVGSLALFVVTLTSGTLFARADDGAHPRGRAASVGTISPLHADEHRLDLQPAAPSGLARLAVAPREQPLSRNQRVAERAAAPTGFAKPDRSSASAPKSLHLAN
ncbi:MAG: hypothetical protein ABI541_11445 [Betaproteobacteria bacterium]